MQLRIFDPLIEGFAKLSEVQQRFTEDTLYNHACHALETAFSACLAMSMLTHLLDVYAASDLVNLARAIRLDIGDCERHRAEGFYRPPKRKKKRTNRQMKLITTEHVRIRSPILYLGAGQKALEHTLACSARNLDDQSASMEECNRPTVDHGRFLGEGLSARCLSTPPSWL